MRAPLLAAASLAAVGVAFVASDYWLSAVLVPILVLGLAGTGLNVLTGYAGQLSVGSAAFMAVGAYGAYNFVHRVAGMPLLVSVALGGLVAALVGVAFGVPSARIRGFQLLVSTLAAQFFVEWALTKLDWFSDHNPSGVITAPPLVVAGVDVSDPRGRYLLTLAVVAVVTLAVRNVVRGAAGRALMAVRDMDTAAAVIGIPIVRTKLVAFALSSFVCGVAGALWAFAYVGTVEPHGLDLNRSFQVLFVAVIGGLGSLRGPYLGAAFVVGAPIALSHAAGALFGDAVDAGLLENLQKVLFGALVIALLVKEPRGLARLVDVAARTARALLTRTPRAAPTP